MMPEVSIIIPTYNSEAYVAQAIESVLHQTYVNFEIILVDDASTDSTLEIVNNFDDKRLRVISNKQNRGVSYARNCGIKAAKGNWIALLDSDDWYAPERLEKLLFVAHKEKANLVADDLNLIRERELQPWSTLLQENEREIPLINIIDAIEFVVSDRPNPINAKRNWSLGYTKPLIERKFLLQHNIKYDENIHVGEDFVLYLECLRHKARFALVSQPYYYYRTRETSLSTRKPTEYLADSCDIINMFIARETDFCVDLGLLEALSKNLVIYQKKLAYYQLLEAIKQKNIISTVTQILNHPSAAIDLLNKFTNILQKKLKYTVEYNKSSNIGFSIASNE